jgi:N-ethylmaleimide reductase
VSVDLFRRFREAGYDGTLMINGGLTPEAAGAYVEEGVADLAAFGVLFIANANLPEIIAAGLEPSMAGFNTAVWYSKDPADDEKGYIDWPLVQA